eukprot:CAMPEP_0197032238 /NCGR_PEP_ID=MMETSP1384-20130603/10963_1 /TAXON_ID=29189 /ORGANISM="Ammonia sp." /LENGTH=402 /DNA_ID=CAMNT_0042461865 /DNA_START=22 /DNA_END=1230 /DNA_ORIENTATION=+
MLSLLDINLDIDHKYRECKKQIERLREQINQLTATRDDKILSTESEALRNRGTYSRKSSHSQKQGLFDPIGVHNKPDRRDKNAQIFSLQRQLEGHFGKIYALHWSTNNSDIVSASRDGQLIIWNAAKRSKKVAIPLRSAWVMTCAYSPNMSLIASGGTDNLVTLFDVENVRGWDINEPTLQLSKHQGYVSCARFVDNTQILTSSGDKSCILWDIDKKQCMQQFFGHSADVEHLALNPQHNNLFVTASVDSSVKVWDIRQYHANGKKPVVNFDGHANGSSHAHAVDVNAVEWFPDGLAFVSGGDDKTVRLFDIRAYKQLNEYKDDAQIQGGVTCLACSKSGYFVIAGYDDDPYCLVWNTMTSDREHVLKHPQQASCLQLSPNGSCVATGCWDRRLRVWGNMME